MSTRTEPSVAIVHDYLNQRGGSERVVLELAAMWPGAPIYTLGYQPANTYPEFAAQDIRPSLLDRVPTSRLRALVPFYPLALYAFGTFEHELVISSSSGWAHLISTAPKTAHVVYCHTLMRTLYTPEDHIGRPIVGGLAVPVLERLRRADRALARKADAYVTNADNVRRRVRDTYGIDSEVVFPPVDTERFRPTPRGERLLVVSRLFPYKRVDLVVAAATRAGLALDVVGEGPSLESLRRDAGPTVSFHGRVDDATVTELMQSASAVCMPGADDFGIVPVEANAAGKPVVALAAGGVLETQRDGVTAALFHESSVDAVLDALRRADELTTSPDELAEAAQRFSRAAFRERFRAIVEAVVDARRGDSALVR